jgi:hypothetical protein
VLEEPEVVAGRVVEAVGGHRSSVADAAPSQRPFAPRNRLCWSFVGTDMKRIDLYVISILISIVLLILAAGCGGGKY